MWTSKFANISNMTEQTDKLSDKILTLAFSLKDILNSWSTFSLFHAGSCYLFVALVFGPARIVVAFFLSLYTAIRPRGHSRQVR